eukprot:scaffold136376_cov172-Phaeocystis_antarctica.AAC.1
MAHLAFGSAKHSVRAVWADFGATVAGQRRRVRVGGCSEAWRELGVRLDTKPAPWLEGPQRSA